MYDVRVRRNFCVLPLALFNQLFSISFVIVVFTRNTKRYGHGERRNEWNGVESRRKERKKTLPKSASNQNEKKNIFENKTVISIFMDLFIFFYIFSLLLLYFFFLPKMIDYKKLSWKKYDTFPGNNIRRRITKKNKLNETKNRIPWGHYLMWPVPASINTFLMGKTNETKQRDLIKKCFCSLSLSLSL